MMCARVSTTPTQFSSNSRTKRRQQGERPGDTHGKHDADRTCGLRADTRGIDEIDLMEEASTGRLKAPTDGANACVNAAKFDQLGSRIRIGPVDFSPPPSFTPRSPFSTSRGRAHGHHLQLEWPLASRSNAGAPQAGRGQGGGEWEGGDPVLVGRERFPRASAATAGEIVP